MAKKKSAGMCRTNCAWCRGGTCRCRDLMLLVVLLAVPIIVFIIGAFSDNQKVVPAAQAQQVRAVAGPAVTSLSQSLFTNLTEAIQKEGPVHALDFCSTEAQNLTREVNDQLTGLSIKRTSLLYRNAKNAPDAYEKEALEYFAHALKTQGNLPADYVQYVSKQEYRYYRPLKVGKGCLSCHGDPKTIDREILSLLEERYPNDKAVGYKEGDFRGLVRVSVPASQIR